MKKIFFLFTIFASILSCDKSEDNEINTTEEQTNNEIENLLKEIDSNQNGLIDIYYIEQLNAIRYDLDGNGVVDDYNNNQNLLDDENEVFSTAFPNLKKLKNTNYFITNSSWFKGYELMNDLDFTKETSYKSQEIIVSYVSDKGWEPIGSFGYPFANGHQGITGYKTIFEGNGFKIKNLLINRPNESNIGLFSYIHNANGLAKIINLGIENVNITGNDNVGTLAGITESPIENCYSLNGIINESGNCIGGLIGKRGQNGGKISDCYSKVNINSPNSINVGGLVGFCETYSLNTLALSSSSIENCYTEQSNILGGENVGGLVGQNFNSKISNCYSKTTVISKLKGNQVHDGTGGLVGSNNYKSLIIKSFAQGLVNSTGNGGGLVGNNYSSLIQECFSKVDVSAYECEGQIVGKNHGISSISVGGVENTFSTGNITITSGFKFSLFPGITSSNNGWPTFRNSYTICRINISNTIYIGRDGSICRFNKQTIGNNIVIKPQAEIMAFTTDELKSLTRATSNWSNPSWDFGSNTDYPGLNINGIIYRP